MEKDIIINNLKTKIMKAYKIEMMTILANTKKEAVEKYLEQYFKAFMCNCEKSFSTLYKDAIETLYT